MGATPFYWVVFNSAFPTGPFSQQDYVPGSQLFDNGGFDSGKYYYVVGTDSSFNPVTGISNIVLLS